MAEWIFLIEGFVVEKDILRFSQHDSGGPLPVLDGRGIVK